MKVQLRRMSMIAFMFALLSACGNPAANVGSPEQEAPTILYLSFNKETEGGARIINELSKEYQQLHPELNFKFEYVPESDLTQRVQLLAASNDLPALFSYQSGRPLLDLINSDAVLDVEKTFADLGIGSKLNNTAVSLLKNFVNDAGLYALPLEMNIEGFWYNKKIFSQYSIEEPQTWDEMLQAAQTLKENGVQAFTVAGKEKWPITRLINAYIIRKYGADAMERVDRGELKVTDKGFVEAAQMVQMMGLQGYFGPRVNTTNVNTSVNQFLEGQAAMIYTGSWELRDFNDTSLNKIGTDQIGFFSIPLVHGGKGTLDEYPVNAGLTTSLSKEAYNPEVGQWIKYIFERYGDRAMSELGIVTGFNVTSLPSNVPTLTKMVIDKINHVKEGALWFEARFSTQSQLLAWDNAQLLVTSGTYSPEQYMSELQEQLEQDRTRDP